MDRRNFMKLSAVAATALGGQRPTDAFCVDSQGVGAHAIEAWRSETVFPSDLSNTFTVLITFGIRDTQPTAWDGHVRMEGGKITQMEGYRLLALEGDRIRSLHAWKIISGDKGEPVTPMPGIKSIPNFAVQKGVILFGVTTSRTAKFEVSTAQGNFHFVLTDLKFGMPLTVLEGRGQVELLPAATKLSENGYRADDFPSVAVDHDGAVWIVWTGFNGTRDEICMRRCKNGRWRGYGSIVPGVSVSGDIWRPQVAVDAVNHPWIVWSQQVDGNWDLYATAFEGNRWREPIRLTEDPSPDINHQLIADTSGNLWLVWQSFRTVNSNIFLKYFKDGNWSQDVQITAETANAWFPSVAVDNSGRAHIVWDTYLNGNYDVYMCSYHKGSLSPAIPVAKTARREVNSSIACDKENQVWVAWDVGGADWGKDQGLALRKHPLGIPLYKSREIGIKCFVEGIPKEPVGSVLEAMPEGERSFLHSPKIMADPQGRVWMLFYRLCGRPVSLPSHTSGSRRAPNSWYCEAYLSAYEGNSWQPAVRLPKSWNRLSSVASLAADANAIWLAWPTDNRIYDWLHRPVANEIYAGMVPLPTTFKSPKLKEPPPLAPIEVRREYIHEADDVRRIRAHRVSIVGKEHRILRGDLHRHTELSWDAAGVPDGSLFDFYRYMLDAAAMDFGASTDHQGGGGYDYWWWLTQKFADLYNVSRRFIPLYGYERSVNYPYGHHNIFHAYRGVPVLPFFYKFGQEPLPQDAGGNAYLGVQATARSVVDNDTQLLYEWLHKTEGICIRHTPGNLGGTDWSIYDPEVEPVVEIFQGLRLNFECEGCPRSGTPKTEPEEFVPIGFEIYEPAGWVWNAWAKGYRLGVIASSDHVSTHISYAMVYAEQATRLGILDAIRKRRTYAATDNIILEFWIDDHFVGDKFETSGPVRLRFKAIGTGPIAGIHVIKNNTYIYSARPNRREVELQYFDNQLKNGLNYYYIRIEQADGQLAWSSPIWVRYHP